MAKSHTKEKKRRVLSAAEDMFTASEEKDEPPIITDASSVLAKEVGMPAAEVNTLLRILHREGRIGLVSAGPWVNIARVQGFLAVPRAIRTGGNGVKKTVSSPSIPEAETEPVEPTDEEKLQAEIDRLNLLVGDLQAKLQKSDRHRSIASDERTAARSAQQTAKGNLAAARVEIRRLEAEVAAASGRQARIDELESELRVMRSQGVISPEVIAALVKATSKRQH